MNKHTLFHKETTFKKGTLVITRRYKNSLFFKDDVVDPEAAFCGILILFMVYGIALVPLIEIHSIVWANIIYFAISGAMTWMSVITVDDPKYVVQKYCAICTNVCFMLLGLMLCYNIQITNPKHYPITNVPYLNFLFKFHF